MSQLTGRTAVKSPARTSAIRLQRLWWLVGALVAGLLCTSAVGQSYEWRDVSQIVSLQPDGRVIVIDTRTLWTDDDFGEAFICFELDAGQSVSLLPSSGAVDAGPEATAYSQPCAAGTELVIRNAGRVSERRVRFAYVLDGTIDPYSDVVQWYWNVIQLDHPPINGYRLVITAPGAMSDPFDAFVHRYDNPEIPVVSLTKDRSILTVYFDHIPPGDGVEVRYLMDPALFETRGTEPGLQVLLEEEATQQRNAP